MRLEDYVSEEWVGYGARSNQRQLPSFCDGLTITTRKILYALRNVKEFEIVERLGLRAAESTHYEHGGSNMVESLVGMVKSFPGTNNVPMFDGEGQFGFESDKAASAPRYISCKISENFKRWFNPKDLDVLDFVKKRGETLEPLVMAPIAPLLLVNGGFGIGSGFQCNIPQYLPQDVIKAVKEVLEDGFVMTQLSPNWLGWKGSIKPDPANRLRFTPIGTFKRIDSSTVVVDCLPPSYDEASYIQTVLVPLYESKQITEFDAESNELNGWHISVKFKRGTLNKLTDDQLAGILGMIHPKRPNLTVNARAWGFDGKIAYYEYIEQFIEEWVEWRLGIYEKRRQFELNSIREQLLFEEGLVWLTDYFLGAEKLPDESFIKTELSKLGLSDTQIERLLNNPIKAFTKQGVAKSITRQSKLSEDYKRLEALDETTYMLEEVNELLSYYEE